MHINYIDQWYTQKIVSLTLWEEDQFSCSVAISQQIVETVSLFLHETESLHKEKDHAGTNLEAAFPQYCHSSSNPGQLQLLPVQFHTVILLFL